MKSATFIKELQHESGADLIAVSIGCKDAEVYSSTKCNERQRVEYAISALQMYLNQL